MRVTHLSADRPILRYRPIIAQSSHHTAHRRATDLRRLCSHSVQEHQLGQHGGKDACGHGLRRRGAALLYDRPSITEVHGALCLPPLPSRLTMPVNASSALWSARLMRSSAPPSAAAPLP